MAGSAAGDLLSRAQAAFVHRSDFEKDFIFGSATAAFQIEGGLKKGGRGESIWDPFAQKNELFKKYSEDAVNHYEKYEEDVKLMKDIGFDAYRFSISWTRIFPTGKKESRNQEGIDFYKQLLRKLRENGIAPFVTLFHWDLPLSLQKEYNGFLDPRIVDDFGDYAETCFQEFGDYVDHWITMNEPFSYSYLSHVDNVHPPSLGTVGERLFATGTNTGESTKDIDVTRDGGPIGILRDGGSIGIPHRSPITRELVREKIMVFKPVTSWAWEAEKLDEFQYPYLVTHNQLLAHAKAVEIFRNKYQGNDKKKKIGITLVSMWLEARDPKSEKDKAAAERALDFFLGWYLAPLVKGDYPKSMRDYAHKEHLPQMSAEDRKKIQGSYDFIGMNYYTARYVAHEVPKKGTTRNYITDQNLMYYETRKSSDGTKEIPIGTDRGASEWHISYPKGMMNLLLHIKENYNNPLIYITENGIDDLDDDCTRVWDSLSDQKRIKYMHDHLRYLLEAIRQGVNVKGYFAWSLLDNFEWQNGFHSRFGLIYVDYKDGAKRYPKQSAVWLKQFLNKTGQHSPNIVNVPINNEEGRKPETNNTSNPANKPPNNNTGATMTNNPPSLNTNTPPPVPWVKVNTNAEFQPGGLAQTGGVVRDQTGKWLGGFAMNIGFLTKNIIGAELWGLHQGLQLAWNLGLPNVIVEVTNQSVVQLVKDQSISNHAYMQQINTIREQMNRRFWNVRLEHKNMDSSCPSVYMTLYATTLPLEVNLTYPTPPQGLVQWLMNRNPSAAKSL